MTSVRSFITRLPSLTCRCTWKSIPSNPAVKPGDEFLDGFPPVHGIHRNISVDGVFGEVAGQYLRVGRGPLLAEFGDQFVG
jgi:hypothetical protein